jgi:arylsulfatase A-like enzyme
MRRHWPEQNKRRNSDKKGLNAIMRVPQEFELLKLPYVWANYDGTDPIKSIANAQDVEITPVSVGKDQTFELQIPPILAADNGPYRRGKGSVYEGGVLVPSVIYWQGVLRPIAVDHRVTVQDVPPTLAKVANLAIAGNVELDGGSQWSLFMDQGIAEPADFAISGMDGKAYYQSNWKLVVKRGEQPQLYDLLEGSDIASQQPERVAAMQKRLKDAPRGESIHQTPWYKLLLDRDAFGGVENHPPWIENVREESSTGLRAQ